ncbi:molybdopterin-binding domain-containing protein [Sandaracinobacteroides saxicola]|uniref:Molybdopterin-binding protein n=1 Tax=Sandaracinobacteroides saxicola TaxID=2759707 RepID=A0A7G5IK47_9SPHN|nr:molybdopterin-binding protein [Sandaracinobacteroides saxicola]QMW23739.1 molybdopterin-binding protein [Sandaracinobacteroides saxicola]
MIFTTCPPAEAIGGLLAHAITLNGRRIAKATPVTPILAAAAAHLPSLTIVRLDPHDVAEDAAAAALADALTGPDLRAAPPLHGRVNLHATRAGLFLATDVTAVNAVDESLTLATLPPFMPVAADQVVATIKIIPFAVAAATLAAATLAATPLALAPWRGGTAHLIHTTPMPAKVIAKTSAVTGARVAALGMTLTQGPPIPHDGVSLADALAAAPPSALILVAGATATADRADVIPAAILAVGGTLIRVGMPADPGNLLVLGQLGSTPVIGLPGCARSPKRNGLDLVLERLAAGLAVTSADIAAMGAGGLLDEAAAALPWGWR